MPLSQPQPAPAASPPRQAPSGPVSCSPADTGSGNEGTRADGRRFCGYLAVTTGAKVVAARDTQHYNSVNMAIPIDFGGWEGPVFEFSDANPNGIQVADPSIYKTQRSRADAAA